MIILDGVLAGAVYCPGAHLGGRRQHGFDLANGISEHLGWQSGQLLHLSRHEKQGETSAENVNADEISTIDYCRNVCSTELHGYNLLNVVTFFPNLRSKRGSKKNYKVIHLCTTKNGRCVEIGNGLLDAVYVMVTVAFPAL